MSARKPSYEWSEASPKYFISPDGQFIGDFEGLYRNCVDPWLQSVENYRSPIKRLITFRIAQLSQRRVIDVGCGTGQSSDLIRIDAGAEVLGIDISPTAISNARSQYPLCQFEVADATGISDFVNFRPTAICMCGLTWCILDTFRDVLSAVISHFPGVLLFHSLTFYSPGRQKHGRDYFTSLDELLPFFSGMTVQETFVHRPCPDDGSHNTLVVARV